MKTNNAMSWIAGTLALAGMGSGCAKQSPVDLGDNRDPAVLGASLSDYEGTWVGYAELARWDDGTDTIRLMLDDSGNGVIEIGEADPLPPPVVDQGYPPYDIPIEFQSVFQVVGLVSGFSYPVSGATVESKRIRLNSSSGELFREWCDQQTPAIAQGVWPESYNCVGAGGWGTTEMGCLIGNEADMPIDCGWLRCVTECMCDATDCWPANMPGDVRMDAALESEGTELEGSFETEQGRFQVRMTRE